MKLFTFKDFQQKFPDDSACLDWLFNHFYPNGVHCKKCNRITNHYRAADRPSYCCANCGNHVHPTADTILHKSSTSLTTWFYASYLMASTRCGISAKQIQRETGVSYKTAWRMFKQIRKLMDEGGSLGGLTVEMDETYIGAPLRNKHQRRLKQGTYKDKQPVFGMVERGGRVIAKVTPDAKTGTIMPIISEYVLPATTVYTDCYATYDHLGELPQGYKHSRINHSARVYVMGDVHTNTIEGLWSLLKRGIGGVYHAVSTKHLQSYCDEYSFRYNHRKDEQPMFLTLLNRIEKQEKVSEIPF
jgi:transposase-like protein